MKNLVYILLIGLFIYSCGSNRNMNDESDNASNDTVRIANDSLEYEVIILEPGFDYWLKSTAKPRSFYTQNYLENKNQFFINTYNSRARNPLRYGDLYTQPINYDIGVDYGFEVNYLLYNYLIYFQERYNQRL